MTKFSGFCCSGSGFLKITTHRLIKVQFLRVGSNQMGSPNNYNLLCKEACGCDSQLRWELVGCHLPVISTFRASACLLGEDKEEEFRHRRITQHGKLGITIQKHAAFPHWHPIMWTKSWHRRAELLRKPSTGWNSIVCPTSETPAFLIDDTPNKPPTLIHHETKPMKF